MIYYQQRQTLTERRELYELKELNQHHATVNQLTSSSAVSVISQYLLPLQKFLLN